MRFKRNAFKLSLLAATVLATPITSAIAQEEGDESSDGLKLNTVTVTALKTEQTLQDAPVAVSAYSGAELTDRGAFEVADIANAAPSVEIATGGNATQAVVRIRGVGSSGVNVGFESAVGASIDGVIRSRAGIALGELLDVERVEVLRGPQGTLFGKNTSAGVISVISRKPEFEFGGNASAQVGSINLNRFTGAVTGPLIEDKLAFRLAGTHTTRDGLEDAYGPGVNPVIEREDVFNDRNRYALKGQLLFTPTDQLEAHLIVDYTDIDEVGRQALPSFVGPFGALFEPLGAMRPMNDTAEGRRAVQVNTDPSETVEDYGAQLEVNWDVGEGTLTSLTAYRFHDAFRGYDLDQGGLDFLAPLDEGAEYNTFTQELRYAGSVGRHDYILGGFYFDEEIDYFSNIALGSQFVQIVTASTGGNPFAPGLFGLFEGQGMRQAGVQTNEGYALFAHNTFAATDRLDLIVGLRYSDTEKQGISVLNGAPTGQFINDPFCGAAPIAAICSNESIDASRSEQEVTGKFVAAYELTDDINTYASYSRGYKAGGINLDRQSVSINGGVRVDATQFEPEFVDAYELGIKADFWGGRSNVNVAIFNSIFEGFQLQEFNGAGFVVANLPELTSRGVEVDSSTLLAEGITFNLAVAYTNASFADDLDGGTNLRDGLEGRRLTNAPLWQGSMALNVDREIPGSGGYRGVGNVSASYRSSSVNSTDLARAGNIFLQDETTLLNASIGVRTPDDMWGLTLSGRNLLDEVFAPTLTGTINQPGSASGFFIEPASWALTLDVKF